MSRSMAERAHPAVVTRLENRVRVAVGASYVIWLCGVLARLAIDRLE